MPPKKKKKEQQANNWSKDDVLKGEKLFHNLCSTCHSLTQTTKSGPPLGRVFNSQIGVNEGFHYSDALAEKRKGGEKWTDANLNKWLHQPQAYAPGNSMAFPGIPGMKERKQLIQYLSAKPGEYFIQ